MNPNIGENIRRFRRERDISQERLAQYLNVSHQAVSKWEGCDVFPDITLLPKLASIFNTSIDQLFGISSEPSAQIINGLIDKAAIFSTAQQFTEAEAIIRDGLVQYPNSYVLMIQLATVLRNLYKEDCSRNKSILDESIEKCKTVLNECRDDELRYKAHRGIAIAYAMLGDQKQAVEEAKKIPVMDDIMIYILAGDERVARCQQDIFNHIKKAASLLSHMADLTAQKGMYEDALYYADTAEKTLELIFEQNDYLDMTEVMNMVYMECAKVYAIEGQYQKCILYIRKCIELLNKQINYPEQTKYTSRAFNQLNSSNSKECYQAMKSKLIVSLQSSVFDIIREMPDFKEIENKL